MPRWHQHILAEIRKHWQGIKRIWYPGSTGADYSNREKFESNPTLNEALEEQITVNYQIQTKLDVSNQNLYAMLGEWITIKLNDQTEAMIISLTANIQRKIKEKLKSMINQELNYLQKHTTTDEIWGRHCSRTTAHNHTTESWTETGCGRGGEWNRKTCTGSKN